MGRRRRFFSAATLFLGIYCSVSSAASPFPQEERIFALQELERPSRILAERGLVFIADVRHVAVYDLGDGRLLRKIGRLGQGPGEFANGPGHMSVLGDRLIVQDMGHADCFKLDGLFSTVIRHPGSMAFYPVLPVGSNIVGFPIIRDDEGLMLPSGCIYDSRLNLIRSFYGSLPALPSPPPPPGRAMKKIDELLIRDYGGYGVYENRIYVADSRRGLSISVFDENGLLLRKINPPVEKLDVPRSFVDAVIKDWKTSKDWQDYYSFLRPVVPEYFPALIDFKIDQGRLCVLTAARKNGLFEMIIMDPEGKILKREFENPLKPDFRYPFYNGAKYDIEDDKIIWLVYNEGKETYELHIR